jgi:hypothetical protein
MNFFYNQADYRPSSFQHKAYIVYSNKVEAGEAELCYFNTVQWDKIKQYSQLVWKMYHFIT